VCTMDDVWALMTQSKSWMDSDPQIEKYFWFGTFRDMVDVNPLNALMYPDTDGPNNGKPTDLGMYYLYN